MVFCTSYTTGRLDILLLGLGFALLLTLPTMGIFWYLEHEGAIIPPPFKLFPNLTNFLKKGLGFEKKLYCNLMAKKLPN